MIRSATRSAVGAIAIASVLLALGTVSQGQTGSEKENDTVKVFHPAGPPVAYDVATIKPADPSHPYTGTTVRKYIAQAYGVPIPWGIPATEFEGSQVVGGPSWIDKDKYVIKGQPADDLREAMQKMPREQKQTLDETMEQALLADRFHLKVHFETRKMRVFDLVPAKGGLKIVAVDPPPTGPRATPPKPGAKMPSGMTRLSVMGNGLSILDATSTTLQTFCNALRGQAPEIAGRPIIDKSGFVGNFDVSNFRFVGAAPPQQGSGSSNTDPDAPSVSSELEEKLGLKLVPAYAQVEVVVIDSIDRPSAN